MNDLLSTIDQNHMSHYAVRRPLKRQTIAKLSRYRKWAIGEKRLARWGVAIVSTLAVAAQAQTYPDESNTGVPPGTVLTVVNGNMTISTANAIVDGKDIRGCVNVTAPGVVIRNSKITCGGGYAIDYYNIAGTWLTIQDTEISCSNQLGGTAIGEEQVTALRNNIHSCENGFDVNKNMLIKDNYIHDMFNGAGDPHTDGIQMWNTATNVVIEHNRIYANSGTSAIISPSQGTLGTIIRDNLFAGGAYTLYCRQSGAGGQQVTNNRFSRIFYQTVGAFGPWTDCGDEAVVCGNVYHETGLPLSGQQASCPGTLEPSPPTSVTVTP